MVDFRYRNLLNVSVIYLDMNDDLRRPVRHH